LISILFISTFVNSALAKSLPPGSW